MQGVMFLVKTVSVVHLMQSGLLLVSSYLASSWIYMLATGMQHGAWLSCVALLVTC